MSPALTVLGRHSSSNVQKVLWTLIELGAPYRCEELGGKFGRTFDPSYLALNPNGTVPTVIDGDFVIWESNTVCRYLANRYGETSLYPSAPRHRALCGRIVDQTTAVSPAELTCSEAHGTGLVVPAFGGT
jgi:glutathione S-transferase